MTGVPTRRRAAVVVASTRASAGVVADTTGTMLAQALRDWGFDPGDPIVVADGRPVGQAIRAAVEAGAAVVLTTGGTGLSPTDRTPEVTGPLLAYEIPGIAERIRAAGVANGVDTAVLSRGLAGVAFPPGRSDGPGCLVVNVAGSRGAVKDAVAVLRGVVPHAVQQLAGGDHERGRENGS